MAIYTYKAKEGPRKIKQGQIEALTREEAVSKIDNMGLFPISIDEKSSSKKAPSRVPLKNLVEFTNQLSTLANAGYPLLSSIETLVYQTEQEKLKPILLDVISEVKDGQPFSAALKKYPGIFSELYTSLVQIGETSGTLGENLRRLAEFLEEEADFKANIVSVLLYPCLILSVGVITVFVLLQFVVPKLVAVFQEIGQNLPFATKVLIGISEFFSRFGIAIAAGIVFLFFIVRKYYSNNNNRINLEKFKLKIPLLGEVIAKIEISRLARTLSILLRNGVPIDISLRVLAETISNLFFRRELSRSEKKIKEGASLSEALRDAGVFQPSFINVITVGENSGRLDSVLESVSRDYAKEINRKVRNLMSLLEPVLIMGVGLIVMFVVLSMLLPIFEIDFNF
ncbi:MAG: type II secretion system F family protein [Candidatus Omnitrophota bacterium]